MVGLIGGTIVGASFATGIASLGLVWYLSRYRGRPGANWFIASLIAQAVWVFSYGCGLLMTGLQLRAVAEGFTWVGMNCVGAFFFAFALEYTGRSQYTHGRWLAVILFSPVTTALLVFTTPFHQLLWRGFRFARVFDLSTVQYAIQPLGYVTVILSFVMAGAGVLLLVETVLSYGAIYRQEAIAVMLSPIPATAPMLIWLGQIGPYPALNLTPALLLTHVALDAYAFIGTPMFESNPVTQRAAERTAVDNLADPLLVLDSTEAVVRLNERAQMLFNIAQTELPVTFESLTGESLETLQTTGELSKKNTIYAVSYTQLNNASGDDVGGIVVLYNITTERNQRQQLSVLNRVLRHNLRNKMTIVQGHAHSLESQLTDQALSQQAHNITAAGDDLLTIAEKIREFERIQDGATEYKQLDLTHLVGSVREAVLTEHPEATINLTYETTDPEIHTDQATLSLALQNLLDNAIRHSDDSSPETQLIVSSADADSDTVVFEVRDTNAPIPDVEIKAIQAAEEQPLVHGSGIGLWIVHWSITVLGGSLEFEYDDGNVLKLILPRTAKETRL